MLDTTARCRKAVGSYDRCVPLDVTLELIPRLRASYGITRVADITRLDRVGIPTFCAIVPNSPALISVYAGKGTTNAAARISAVFEAVERQVAALPGVPTRRERVSRICESLDLDRLGLKASARESYVDCVEGVDLLCRQMILVPLAAVQNPWFGEPIFPASTSNGLAAGNTSLEATYHALCEVIERHVWSLYHLRCELFPRMLLGFDAGDFGLASELRTPTGNAAVDALLQQLTDATGLRVRIMYLDDPELPPVMLASVVEERSAPPMSHIGLGCSLSPAHAAIRAIAEAAQSRLTDIQGAREDTLRVDDGRLSSIPEHTRRLGQPPENCWFYDVPARAVALDSIPDTSTEDLAEDVKRIVAGLRRSGVSSAATVDLSPPDAPVKVVRAIVPELETTCVDGRIGPRARAFLNPFRTC